MMREFFYSPDVTFWLHNGHRRERDNEPGLPINVERLGTMLRK